MKVAVLKFIVDFVFNINAAFIKKGTT